MIKYHKWINLFHLITYLLINHPKIIIIYSMINLKLISIINNNLKDKKV